MDIRVLVEDKRSKEERDEDGEEGIGVDVELDLHGGRGVGGIRKKTASLNWDQCCGRGSMHKR